MGSLCTHELLQSLPTQCSQEHVSGYKISSGTLHETVGCWVWSVRVGVHFSRAPVPISSQSLEGRAKGSRLRLGLWTQARLGGAHRKVLTRELAWRSWHGGAGQGQGEPGDSGAMKLRNRPWAVLTRPLGENGGVPGSDRGGCDRRGQSGLGAEELGSGEERGGRGRRWSPERSGCPLTPSRVALVLSPAAPSTPAVGFLPRPASDQGLIASRVCDKEIVLCFLWKFN